MMTRREAFRFIYAFTSCLISLRTKPIPAMVDTQIEKEAAVTIQDSNVYKERLKKVEQVCKRQIVRSEPRIIGSYNFMHGSRGKLTYCINRKVASSAWGTFMNEMKDRNRFMQIFMNKTLFTFVRHPFDRLVSAYVDKFELSDIKTNVVYPGKEVSEPASMQLQLFLSCHT